MSGQPMRQPTLPRRGLRRLLLSLLMLIAAAAAAALLSPDSARAAYCLGPPASVAAADEPSPGDNTSDGKGDDGGGESGIECGNANPPPPPPPPPPPDDGGGGGGGSCSGVVVLYQHTNFEGQCWGFDAGETDWIGSEANDQASSIWVADGYVATIFLHAWFGGDSHNTNTTADPWGWGGIGNDNVSSLVVQPSEPQWYNEVGDGETTDADARNLTYFAPSGCARVGTSVVHRNFYRRLWRYALLTSFCWNGSSVTAVYEREIAVDIDPIPFPFSLIQGWRYTPIDFQQGEPGYPTTILRAQGRFDFCGFRYGCTTTRQPYIRIDLRANGEAFCSTNVRTQSFACQRGS